MQIKIYADLYVSDALKGKEDHIIRKLCKNKIQTFLYVVTLSRKEKPCIEFYSALLFQQKFYKDKPVFVIGLANSYEDALCLVRGIVDQVYQETKDTDICNYIRNRQNKFEEGQV